MKGLRGGGEVNRLFKIVDYSVTFKYNFVILRNLNGIYKRCGRYSVTKVNANVKSHNRCYKDFQLAAVTIGRYIKLNI